MVKKQYYSVDLMKFIASILVVSIHTHPFFDINATAYQLFSQGIPRIAVPLFFIASAFFLFKNYSEQKTKQYCKRIMKLYSCWFIILLPITVYNRIILSEYSLPISLLMFVKSFFLTSTFSGSWYLMSCVFCALLFMLLERLEDKKRRIITIILSIVIYVFCVFCSGYGNIIINSEFGDAFNKLTLIFAKPHTSIIVGIPYFALGRYISKNENRFTNHNKTYIFASVICFLMLIAEILLIDCYNLRAQYDCMVMLLPCALFIFLFVINCKLELKHSKELRVASTIIFFSQFIIVFAFEVISWAYKISVPYTLRFLITVVLGLVVTFAVIKLQKVKGFGWLKYLY